MHLDYYEVWVKYFPNNKNFFITAKAKHVTQNQNNLIINSHFSDISSTPILILFSESNVNNLLSHCFAERCSSQNPEERSGFVYIYTNGTTHFEDICMISNTIYDITDSAHNLNLISQFGSIIDCSNSRSVGTGEWTSSIRTNADLTTKYCNSSFNTCRDIPSFIFININSVSYCNIAGNIASLYRTIHFADKKHKLFSSTFINNTEAKQGIIFCEMDCTLDVSFCSLIKNKGISGFYAYTNQGISHMIVSNCSLIENTFTYDKYAYSPSTIDYKDNEETNFSLIIPDRLNCEEFTTIFIHVHTQCICSYSSFKYFLYILPIILL